MANLTFSDLENEVYAHTQIDSTNATNQTNVDRWLNYTQQDLCSRWPWPFMLNQETLVTIPDYTTGTVSVNAASGTVTGVGTTFTTTHADGTYFIQFNTANDWYPVTARASATSITISPVYAQTSNLSASAFTLRKMYYSLSSAVDEIIDIRNWDTPVKLIQVDPRFIDGLNPNAQSTNSSYAYMTYGYDTSGNLRFSPYPFPSDARLFNFRTKIRPTDGAVSVPNKYAQVIAWGATAIGFAAQRKLDLAQAWNTKYEDRIARMKGEYRQSEDNQPILTSIDSVQRSRWISMPGSYPVISSR